MAGFYHLYIEPRKGVSRRDVETKLNLALDWFRLDQGVYILCTNKDAAVWHARLKPLVESGGHLFVCRLDTDDRQGWMSKDFWQWFYINRDRLASKEPGGAGDRGER